VFVVGGPRPSGPFYCFFNGAPPFSSKLCFLTMPGFGIGTYRRSGRMTARCLSLLIPMVFSFWRGEEEKRLRYGTGLKVWMAERFHG